MGNDLDSIKETEWKNFILGLQEKLNLEQLELLDRVGLKPDFHVSEWISGKRIPVNDKKLKFLELALKLGYNIKDLIEFGRYIRKSLFYNNKWIFIGNAKTLEDIKAEILISKKDGNYLNILKFFPLKRGKNLIKFIKKREKIMIFYDEKRNTRPTPLFLPKLLRIDKDFLVGLGIYLGEGSRNRHPKVTNAEPKIINCAIKFFDLFGIDRTRLKVWIQLHERSNASINAVKDYWLKNTYLKPENIRNVRIKKSLGSAPVEKFGVVHLEVNSILLQLLIERLINKTPSILRELPFQEITFFLKGLFAAEGSVGFGKSGSINEINFTSVRANEREIVKKLLNKLNIVTHDDNRGFRIRVFGFDNIQKFVDMGIFQYHPGREEKLNKGFSRLTSSLKII